MRKSLSRIGVLTGRNVKETVRDPLSLIFTILMPLFMELLFYFIFHSLTSQFEMKYLAPGIVVFAQAFLTLFTGMLIATDRSTSFLTRLYVSSARPYEFIFSYALSVVPITVVQSALFFTVGGLFDNSLFGSGMFLAMLLSLFTSLFFIAAGILAGSMCTEKSIGGIASIFIAGQSVLSGMWFPLEGISDGMIALMNALPFRNASMLVQNALNGTLGGFENFWRPFLILTGYTAVAIVAAITVYGSKMKAR